MNDMQYYCCIYYNICCYRFMGYVNMLGVAYESPTVATGYGMYIAQVCVCMCVCVCVCVHACVRT